MPLPSGAPLRGLFLAFEGVEGAGKTTRVRLLASALRAAGREVTMAREPGSTPLGERFPETFPEGGFIKPEPRPGPGAAPNPVQGSPEVE